MFLRSTFTFNVKTAEALNEHIRQIENETKVVEVMKSFPNDELVGKIKIVLFTIFFFLNKYSLI